MKKILKYLGIFVVALLLITSGTLAWLFSSSGNEFLKNKIIQIANEKAPIGLEFTHFKLGFNSYAFSLTDKQKSQIALNGDYSLFTLNTNAKIYAIIKDLSPYEQLIGMKLNGGINLNGDIVKKSNDLEVKADINAFNSTIHTDITLENYNPRRLFITTEDGIKLESLLAFLNQPKYASGKILLNADMDISDLNAPSGGFQIASNAISPNITLLNKSYGILLPNDPIKLAMNGKAQKDHIITTLLASSSYLKLSSDNLKASLKDYATNGDILINLEKISLNGIALKSPIVANINLKSSNITDQEAALALHLIKNPILAHINLPNYTPTDLTIRAQDLSLKEILNLVANYTNTAPYDVNGVVSLNAKVDKINLNTLNYQLDANLKSQIASLNLEGLQIANNNTLNAQINGDSKKLKAQAQSDLFDSKLVANAVLNDYSPANVEVEVNHLNLQKFAKLLKYDVQGQLDAKANLKNFKNSSFDGDFSIDSKQITLTKATLNALSGMKFKQDISLALNGNGSLKNGNGEAQIKANGKDLNVEIYNAKINLPQDAYSANFTFNTPDIANINPLDMTLKGALSLKGSAGFANGIPSFNLQNKDFGDLNVQLKEERFTLQGANLDVKKIANFTGNGKLVKGGIINTNADLTIKGKDSKTILANLNGVAELNSKNLEIYSVDIDALVSNFEKTNSINLLDVGAFVLAGPLGVAVTKGTNVSMLGLNAVIESKSVIKELEAKFNVKNGIATAQDVAFATGKTRIAAIGAINLNNNAFQNFTIGLLDNKDCAKYSQKIKGTLDSPKIEVTQTTISTAVNLATSLFGQLKKGAQNVAKPVIGDTGKCEPFYTGSVRHPK
ncbi:AsmA-like C-terminal region-containing protein [uncultured Helicobacter sp.]|uniref:AsmA-like C-terminal region-containing protein n=1 Tax=uncultured Helicobacter sp. TaxID=175537 RepID=UPI00262DF05E|nr:AsmA-like C-terminal region-containing protein [uncultured Helicobacter sp.]